MSTVVRNRRVMTRGGIIRWEHVKAPPTYAPSPELLAEVAAYWKCRERKTPPTNDLALLDADESITGWREHLDASLHHYFPRKDTDAA